MNRKLKLGDVVRLRSGGPHMTISEIGKYGYDDVEKFKCRWFDDKHKPTELIFAYEELELVAS